MWSSISVLLLLLITILEWKKESSTLQICDFWENPNAMKTTSVWRSLEAFYWN